MANKTTKQDKQSDETQTSTEQLSVIQELQNTISDLEEAKNSYKDLYLDELNKASSTQEQIQKLTRKRDEWKQLAYYYGEHFSLAAKGFFLTQGKTEEIANAEAKNVLTLLQKCEENS